MAVELAGRKVVMWVDGLVAMLADSKDAHLAESTVGNWAGKKALMKDCRSNIEPDTSDMDLLWHFVHLADLHLLFPPHTTYHQTPW